MRLSTETQSQGQGKQAAEMNAKGHRIMEMTGSLMQRELHMESQMQEMCSQIQTMGAMLKIIQPQTEDIVHMGSTQYTKNSTTKPPTKKSDSQN